MIEQRVKKIERIARENPTDKNIAIAAEATQRYVEYLDDLLDADLTVDESVIVEVEGKKIKFKSAEAMSAWITTLYK